MGFILLAFKSLTKNKLEFFIKGILARQSRESLQKFRMETKNLI
jgi:hypothetical protein